MSGPFETAAWAYLAAGWSPIPLPAGAKNPPPSWYTGWEGRTPSGPDIQAWIDAGQGAGNVALTLRGDEDYSLDVDAYNGGSLTLALLMGEAGEPLPDTIASGSRPEEEGSRIYHFRAKLPAGRVWRDKPGEGIEALHRGHRYAVVGPSVHPSGGTYRWFGREDIPQAGERAWLPPAWVEVLSKPGETLPGTPAERATSLETLDRFAKGDMCTPVCAALDKALAACARADGGSIHDHVNGSVRNLVGYGFEGHRGVYEALVANHAAAVGARMTHRGDSRAKADNWWFRSLDGIVGKELLRHDGAIADSDPCGAAGFDPGVAPGATPAQARMDPFGPPAAGTAGGAAGAELSPDAAPFFVDLTGFLDGTYVPPVPSVGGMRDTGADYLLYPGRWHTAIALNTAGKSWWALWHVVQEMRAGHRVVYAHFEESMPAGTLARLRSMAPEMSAADIGERFRWVDCSRRQPHERWIDAMATERPALVILDGINAACGQYGWDVASPESVGHYRSLFVRPAVAVDAAVLSLGHPPKANGRQNERHGFGSTAWLDEVDGVGFRMKASKRTPIRRGKSGLSTVYVVKDRYGEVERLGDADPDADDKDDVEVGWYYLGAFHVDSSPERGNTVSWMTAPAKGASGKPRDKTDELGEEIMKTLGPGGSFRIVSELEDRLKARGVKFNNSNVKPALIRLADQGAILWPEPVRPGGPRPGRVAEGFKIAREASPPQTPAPLPTRENPPEGV